MGRYFKFIIIKNGLILFLFFFILFNTFVDFSYFISFFYLTAIKLVYMDIYMQLTLFVFFY